MELAGELLEFGFEAREEIEGVGGGTGESGEDFLLIEAADFFCGVLEDVIAQRDLAVCGHDDLAVAADADYGCGADAGTGRGSGVLAQNLENLTTCNKKYIGLPM